MKRLLLKVYMEGTNRTFSSINNRTVRESEFCDREIVQTALEYCQLLALTKDDLRVGLVAVQTQTVIDGGSVLFIQQHRVGV